jgi:hypothetical protein
MLQMAIDEEVIYAFGLEVENSVDDRLGKASDFSCLRRAYGPRLSFSESLHAGAILKKSQICSTPVETTLSNTNSRRTRTSLTSLPVVGASCIASMMVSQTCGLIRLATVRLAGAQNCGSV